MFFSLNCTIVLQMIFKAKGKRPMKPFTFLFSPKLSSRFTSEKVLTALRLDVASLPWELVAHEDL